MRVLVAGVSTRAAAESAARAGFAVTAIDAFGDRDQHPAVRALSMPRDAGRAFTPVAAARAARGLDRDAAVYLSSFDNHPRAVRMLAAGGALWGNTPDALRRVRDPRMLAEVLGRRGFAVPAVRRDAPPADTGPWLLKPLASGGGHGIRPWRGGRVPARGYLQARVEGIAASIAFAGCAGSAALLGLARQLVGERAFGSTGFRYCGSIVSTASQDGLTRPALVAACERLAGAVVEAFGLVGVGGIDLILREGEPIPIEVNPRWTGSLEVIERACGVPLFAAHAGACRDGHVPAAGLEPLAPGRAAGKAIVFARRDVVVGDTSAWLADPDVRDVPHEGEAIAAGRPVCTVFADGGDYEDCRAGLVARAGRIYADLATWTDAAVTMARSR